MFIKCGIFLLFIGIVSANAVNTTNEDSLSRISRMPNHNYQVFIASAGQTFEFGSGVILTRRTILTVATLIRGFKQWNVGSGSAALSEMDYVVSSTAFVHPEYVENLHNYNVGIILLPKELPNQMMYLSLPLPNQYEAAQPRVNQEGTIVGFGVLNRNSADISPLPSLKKVFAIVSKEEDCLHKYPDIALEANFCARDEIVGNDIANVMCAGDAGNAFVMHQRGVNVLAGLSSLVSNDCTKNDMTSFVRIQYFYDWIVSIVALTAK